MFVFYTTEIQTENQTVIKKKIITTPPEYFFFILFYSTWYLGSYLNDLQSLNSVLQPNYTNVKLNRMLKH